jgi:hypothetical protein
MTYEKMNDYIETIFLIFKMVIKQAVQQKNHKMHAIALTIYNYALKKAKDNNFDLDKIQDKENIDLTPFFDYVYHHNIEFFDFSNIKIEDVDITKEKDLERFVVSHIYYITQK